MKKSITKILAAVMAVVMVAGLLAACSGGDSDNKKKFKIGVIQLVDHDALDASYEGFKAAIKNAGYLEGETVEYIYHNAQGEQSNCTTIAEQLKSENCDLILAIATPAAQAVANAIKDVPILVTAVTDPAQAELVATNRNPGGNVSGTSDLNPVGEQIDLLQQIAPNAKNVGLFYCSSEDNSKLQISMAKDELAKKGLNGIEFTVTQLTEIQSVVESMAGKVDAIYIPTDNLLASGMATASQAAIKAGIPLIVGESGMVANGGLATRGLSYFNLGKQTGEMALEILLDGKNPGDMPIEYLSDEYLEYAVNTETAKALNVTLPEILQGEDVLQYPAVG